MEQGIAKFSNEDRIQFENKIIGIDPGILEITTRATKNPEYRKQVPLFSNATNDITPDEIKTMEVSKKKDIELMPNKQCTIQTNKQCTIQTNKQCTIQTNKH